MRSQRARREIEDAISMGWRIDSETPERVVLVKREFGSVGVHLIIALLTFWWTMGVGNVAYAAYKYFNDSQRRVVWDDRHDEHREAAHATTMEGHETADSTAVE